MLESNWKSQSIRQNDSLGSKMKTQRKWKVFSWIRKSLTHAKHREGERICGLCDVECNQNRCDMLSLNHDSSANRKGHSYENRMFWFRITLNREFPSIWTNFRLLSHWTHPHARILTKNSTMRCEVRCFTYRRTCQLAKYQSCSFRRCCGFCFTYLLCAQWHSSYVRSR